MQINLLYVGDMEVYLASAQTHQIARKPGTSA